MMWGSNVPVTRTPDAHWMAEVRYRGTKVVTVSPDYADNTKFADEWLPAQAGTDAALAMAMGHVILKEFFVERRVPFFVDYVPAVHRPAVPGHASTEHDGAEHGGLVPGKFLTAAGPGRDGRRGPLEDRAARRRHRRAGGAERLDRLPLRRVRRGKWNLDLEGVTPALSLAGEGSESAEVLLPTSSTRRRPARCCAAASRCRVGDPWSPRSST